MRLCEKEQRSTSESNPHPERRDWESAVKDSKQSKGSTRVRLVYEGRRLRPVPSRGPTSVKAAVVIPVHLVIALDCDCGQTRGALNQLNFLERGAARNAGVHLERSKQFVVLSKNTGGAERVQAKMFCVRCHIGKIDCILLRRGNERNDVANIAIENTADLIQHLREGRTGRD